MSCRRRGRGGFSLVELVVATAVMLVAMLLATQLLLESQIETGRRMTELSGSMPGYATARLRHDTEGATGVIALDDEWRDEAMRLLTVDGGRVVWRLRGEDFERVRLDAEGELSSHQVLLHDVVGWRWRRIGPRVVDVYLRYRAPSVSGPALLQARRTWAAPSEATELWLRIGMRVAGP